MGNQVHASAIIGPGVVLGADNVIGPYAVITGPCRIGDRNWIGAHTVVGAAPEIRGHEQGLPWGGNTLDLGVELGDDTTLREFTTVHRGTHRITRIGSRCYVMNKSYIGHDALIDDDVTISPHVALAGHVVVGAGATLGMAGAVHQRRVVGVGAMVGMGAVVTRDVPPYAKAFGSPARVRGANEVGMRRSGVSDHDIAALTEWYGSDEPEARTWTPPEALRSAWNRYEELTRDG